jgi:hypothetical protein
MFIMHTLYFYLNKFIDYGIMKIKFKFLIKLELFFFLKQ